VLAYKRRDVYRNKNGVVYFSKKFICKSIIELMQAELKRPFTPTKSKTRDLSLKDNSYFIPNDLYSKLSDYFEAFYSKRPDKNVFYICIRMLEKDGKIEKIKIKRQVYYKLV
jgi:hypothetical protein